VSVTCMSRLVAAAVMCVLLGTGVMAEECSCPPVKEKPPGTNRKLKFAARPVKPVFSPGEKVLFRLQLRNVGRTNVFVSRTFNLGDFVYFEITGPKGRRAAWCGSIRSVMYSQDSFTVLKPGESVSKIVELSCNPQFREGYQLDTPGRYIATGAYSLGPKEYFAPAAGSTDVPQGIAKARPAAFAIAAR
jgi:hypothetical protein